MTVLRELLSVYWLRPETALWRSIDIKVMKDFKFNSPSLDLGCGDGIFSFIRAGGKFDIKFDVYQSIGNIENFFDNADVYNHFDENKVNPLITKQPNYQIDIALDHKQNLLNKANTLGLHKKLVKADANASLPFEDNSFKTIFSNIIYWLNNPQKVFDEIYRTLDFGGRCCIFLPNTKFLNFSFYYDLYIKQNLKEFDFLKLLDRGRITDNVKQMKSYKDWKSIIESSGLNIIEHKKHLSEPTIKIWDIGLRPMFPLLYKMIQNIENEKVVEIKKEWIETFMMFLEPLVENDNGLIKNDEYAFHYFVLEKRVS